MELKLEKTDSSALLCMLASALLYVFVPISAAADNSLKPFQWQSRLLLLFTPERGHAGFQDMMRTSQRHQDGFIKRDLLRISVIRGTKQVNVHGLPASDADHAGLPGPEQLYIRYNIYKNRFAVLLIGKDGTVKAQWQRPVPIDTIFDKIDSMPARGRGVPESSDKNDTDHWFSGFLSREK